VWKGPVPLSESVRLALFKRVLTGSLSLTGRAVDPRGGPVVFVARAVFVDDDCVRARPHLAAARPERAALPGRRTGKSHFLFFGVFV